MYLIQMFHPSYHNWFDALHPRQQIFSHVGTVLSSGKVSCSDNTMTSLAVILKLATLNSPFYALLTQLLSFTLGH